MDALGDEFRALPQAERERVTFEWKGSAGRQPSAALDILVRYSYLIVEAGKECFPAAERAQAQLLLDQVDDARS